MEHMLASEFSHFPHASEFFSNALCFKLTTFVYRTNVNTFTEKYTATSLILIVKKNHLAIGKSVL